MSGCDRQVHCRRRRFLDLCRRLIQTSPRRCYSVIPASVYSIPCQFVDIKLTRTEGRADEGQQESQDPANFEIIHQEPCTNFAPPQTVRGRAKLRQIWIE